MVALGLIAALWKTNAILYGKSDGLQAFCQHRRDRGLLLRTPAETLRSINWLGD